MGIPCPPFSIFPLDGSISSAPDNNVPPSRPARPGIEGHGIIALSANGTSFAHCGRSSQRPIKGAAAKTVIQSTDRGGQPVALRNSFHVIQLQWEVAMKTLFGTV